MLSMPARLDLYEEIRALSWRMVQTARINDWERLIELERRVSALRDTLMADTENAPLSRAENERKLDLIQEILANDAEIRRHTEPWMEHVRQFLGSQSRRRQVQQAYAVASELGQGAADSPGA
jgi:flagellar protein FliT